MENPLSFADHLTDLEPLLTRYGYAALFGAIFVEGVGIPAPGQTLLLAAAVLAARGNLSLGLVLGTATIASAAGCQAGFALGRYGGHRVLDRFAGGGRLARLEQLFARLGVAVVMLGRFVDGTRQLAAITAGALEMPSATFFAANLLGAVLWASFWGLGAYWLGQDFHAIAAAMHHVRPWMLILTAAVAAAALAWLLRGKARRTGTTPTG
jgi:membrane protein DedA with SNARE-associated domain